MRVLFTTYLPLQEVFCGFRLTSYGEPERLFFGAPFSFALTQSTIMTENLKTTGLQLTSYHPVCVTLIMLFCRNKTLQCCNTLFIK